jgi:hypothetical protein
MARPTTVVSSGKRLLPAIVAVSLLLPLLLAGTARAADLSVSSSTYLRYYKQELASGNKNTFAPLYEYLSADATNLGGTSVAFHFFGWGRVDFADQTGTGKESGDLGSAYLEYLHPKGNAQMKLGRFFLAEGVAVETLDGAFFKVTTPVGIGISGYGGVPVEHSILDNVSTGNSLYGGRVFFVRGGFVELGASYLKEKGPFEGKDRELYGGDLWLRVAGPVELTGQAAYNRSTQAMASQRYAVRVVPGSRFDISAGYEAYSYKDLFQTSLHPAFLSPSVDNTDKVRTIFGVLDWEVVSGLTLELAAKNIRHDNVSTGNANRGEVGVRYAFNDRRTSSGCPAAITADQDRAVPGVPRIRRLVFGSSLLPRRAPRNTKEIDGKKNATGRRVYRVQVLVPVVSGDLTIPEANLSTRLQGCSRRLSSQDNHGRKEMTRRAVRRRFRGGLIACSSDVRVAQTRRAAGLPGAAGAVGCLECQRTSRPGLKQCATVLTPVVSSTPTGRTRARGRACAPRATRRRSARRAMPGRTR